MPSTEPRFDNSYARLPERFFVRMAATPVRAPRLLKLNVALARDLGLDPDWLESPDGMAMLAGNAVPASAESLAQAYAGHQFGGFSPQLGDGRALLIGEVIDPAGRRFDIQLKGSGPTPFSRRGDGRAALGPVLREYIVAEAMHALGVPTTRALAVVSTGERVIREEVQPGGILTRVAASHIRVGTFQYFAARGDVEAIRTLVDHVIARHYPETERADNRALALLEAVMQRQADLIAQWMNLGFIHGVMNTDNMAVSGETIDYGPCAFMDTYHPGQVYSSIDAQGRYAYGNQPAIGLWNLTRLAETLLALIDPDEKAAVTKAEALLGTFPARFNNAHVAGLRRKLGLMTVARGDAELARDLLSAMADGAVDFTNTFLALADAAADEGAIHVAARAFRDNRAFYAWAERWRVRLDAEVAAPDARRAMMLRANPAVIPRNHRVEEALAAAVTNGDLRLFERLVDVLSRPFALNDEDAAYAAPPQPHEVVRATFCGT